MTTNYIAANLVEKFILSMHDALSLIIKEFCLNFSFGLQTLGILQRRSKNKLLTPDMEENRMTSLILVHAVFKDVMLPDLDLKS